MARPRKKEEPEKVEELEKVEDLEVKHKEEKTSCVVTSSFKSPIAFKVLSDRGVIKWIEILPGEKVKLEGEEFKVFSKNKHFKKLVSKDLLKVE